MKKLSFRPVTMEDAELILIWRNDIASRNNSFSQDEICMETHINWLEKKLADVACQMFILADDGEPVGQIRIDILGRIGEISYLIAPGHRGKGYGTDILMQCEKVVDKQIEVLAGLVKDENKASKRCFEKAGYVKLNGGDTDCYIKIIN